LGAQSISDIIGAMRLRKLDLTLVFILPIVAAIITVAIRTGLLVSIVMFFGVPTAYLALRNPGIFKKSFAFASLLSVPLSLFVDTLAAINGSWVIPESIFPIRLFGVATIEVYFFGLLWVLYAIMWYEHFFDGGKRGDRLSAQMSYVIWLSVALLIYVVVGFLFDNQLLHIPYFYGLVGVVLVVIPLIAFIFIYPFFWRRFALIGVYFFCLLSLFELAALATVQWTFPGPDFIGFVPMFGFRVPVEEVVIWMLLATASVLSYYEFFGDNRSIG
jgi:hypothetical protein